MSLTSMRVASYQRRRNSQMNGYKTRLDKLKFQMKKNKRKMKVRYANQVSDLEKRVRALAKEKSEFNGANQSAWEDIEKRIDKMQKEHEMAQ